MKSNWESPHCTNKNIANSTYFILSMAWKKIIKVFILMNLQTYWSSLWKFKIKDTGIDNNQKILRNYRFPIQILDFHWCFTFENWCASNSLQWITFTFQFSISYEADYLTTLQYANQEYHYITQKCCIFAWSQIILFDCLPTIWRILRSLDKRPIHTYLISF